MARNNVPSLIEVDSPAAPDADAVVLVHGLWLGAWAMVWLGRRFAARGMRVLRFGYPSMHQSLGQNAAALRRCVRAIEAPQMHWVGHSLGGLLVFRALEEGNFTAGRVVMIGSPVGGSAAAARLARCKFGRRMLGAALPEWLSAPRTRWTLPHELGVIAGTRSIGLGRFVAPELSRPNDGVVSLAETRMDGAKESIALPVCHAGMLLSDSVAHCAAEFLTHGRFPAREHVP